MGWRSGLCDGGRARDAARAGSGGLYSLAPAAPQPPLGHGGAASRLRFAVYGLGGSQFCKCPRWGGREALAWRCARQQKPRWTIVAAGFRGREVRASALLRADTCKTGCRLPAKPENAGLPVPPGHGPQWAERLPARAGRLLPGLRWRRGTPPALSTPSARPPPRVPRAPALSGCPTSRRARACSCARCSASSRARRPRGRASSRGRPARQCASPPA